MTAKTPKKTATKKTTAKERKFEALRLRCEELEEVCDELVRRGIITDDLELVTIHGPVRLLPWPKEVAQ